MKIELWCGDCEKILDSVDRDSSIIVTDPPFNIGYGYRSYKDRLPEDEYYAWLKRLFAGRMLVCIMYPEMLYRLAIELNKAPDRVISWVYHSNTRRQHRDIAFWGVTPDFSQVRQPYKNQNDKRIKKLMENGSAGSKLYDWFEVNQVKNVSKEKTIHPCQMPLDVMLKVVGVLPGGYAIVDPFMGSGTTGVACWQLGRDFMWIEIDDVYYNIAQDRIRSLAG